MLAIGCSVCWACWSLLNPWLKNDKEKNWNHKPSCMAWTSLCNTGRTGETTPRAAKFAKRSRTRPGGCWSRAPGTLGVVWLKYRLNQIRRHCNGERLASRFSTLLEAVSTLRSLDHMSGIHVDASKFQSTCSAHGFPKGPSWTKRIWLMSSSPF